MIDCVRFLLAAIEDEVNAFDFVTQRLYTLKLIGCVDVHMCDLVVSYGEGVARAWVQQFKALFGAHAKQAGLAQFAVDMHGIIDRFDPVFTYEDYPNALCIEVLDQVADDGINLSDAFGNIPMSWPEPL